MYLNVLNIPIFSNYNFKEKELAPKQEKFDKAKLEDLLKRRFFFVPSFEIYGGKQIESIHLVSLLCWPVLILNKTSSINWTKCETYMFWFNFVFDFNLFLNQFTIF